MVTSAKPPRLYIEEWMQAAGLDRKRLAERMKVSAGTITKKLGNPDAIDGKWLARLAVGVKAASPLDLYRDPALGAPPVEAALRCALLAYGVDHDEIDQVMRVISTYVAVSDDEKAEQTSSEDQPQPSSPRREPALAGKRVR